MSEQPKDEIIKDDFDKEYLILLEEIESRLDTIKKHDLLRIVAWIKKLNQITSNKEWKKNRNLHALFMLDMILNNSFEEPYNKFPPEQHVPILSKSVVKSKLSGKFNNVLVPLEAKLNNTMNRKNDLSVNKNVKETQMLESIKEEPRLTIQENPALAVNEDMDKPDIESDFNKLYNELISQLEEYDIEKRFELVVNMIEERKHIESRINLEIAVMEKICEDLKEVRIKAQNETKADMDKMYNKQKQNTYNHTFGVKKDKEKENDLSKAQDKLTMQDKNRINRYRFI